MIKRFKIIETNLESIKDSHFTCETKVGKSNVVFDSILKTNMFDGIKVKLIGAGKYIVGEVHGPQPE